MQKHTKTEQQGQIKMMGVEIIAGDILEGSGVIAPDKPQSLEGATVTPPEVEYRTIPLTQGQVMFVSPRCHGELGKFKWYAWWSPKSRVYYAVRQGPRIGKKRTLIWAHREVLGLKHGDPRTGDHKDHTRTLDNTDNNLRIAVTGSEQAHNKGKYRTNTSGYKGVTFNADTGKWKAQIVVDGKKIYLGLHVTKELAYVAYCEAAKMYFGEFACLN